MNCARAGLIFLASVVLALAAHGETAIPITFSNAPSPLVWDAMEKTVDLPGMTNLAYFTFLVTNNSAAETTILATEAECECTVVDVRKNLPWKLGPGDGGPLNVRVNIRGRFGLFTKTITVHSTAGTQVLTVNMKIPLTPAAPNISIRQQDVLVAKADRQAVFQGRCAVCHVPAVVNMAPASLFQKACGICHAAEHRADFVPDLAALNREISADYWRTNIMFGKAGSVMPAFAKSAGGILETNQIESLVAYLVNEFPARGAASAQTSVPGNTNQQGAPLSAPSPPQPSKKSAL